MLTLLMERNSSILYLDTMCHHRAYIEDLSNDYNYSPSYWIARWVVLSIYYMFLEFQQIYE